MEAVAPIGQNKVDPNAILAVCLPLTNILDIN